MGDYDVAQICMNGHVITAAYKDSPERHQNFCKQCGARSTTKCLRCETTIKGYYYPSGVISIPKYALPSYCISCGGPYPWTQLKVEAIEGLIDLAPGLTEDERKTLKEYLPDIANATPKSELAAVKFKKTIAKSREFGKSILQKTITDLATDQTKTFLLSLAKDWMP